MSGKTEAMARLQAAEKGSAKVLDLLGAAHATLGRDVSVNGLGVLHDVSAVRGQLQEAQAQIMEALKQLDAIELPANSDYDFV